MKMFMVFMLVIACVFDSQATEVKVGGGMVFENSIPGGALAIDFHIPHKPLVISFAADYFKGSGHTSIPFSIKGLFRTHLSPNVAVYLGGGGGLIYAKLDGAHGATETHVAEKAAVGDGSHSSTDALAAAVAGLDLNISSGMGIFVEVSLDRALVSGAKNEVAAKAGVFFGLGHHGHHEDAHH